MDQRVTTDKYEDIRFQDGQIVVVEASGEVNTDIKGSHWVNYVNPCSESQPATDRLYHGLIWIPGAVSMDGNPVPVGTGLVPIASVTRVRPCRRNLPWQPAPSFPPLMLRISDPTTPKSSHESESTKKNSLRLGYQGEEKALLSSRQIYSRYGYTSRGAMGCSEQMRRHCAQVKISIYDPPAPEGLDKHATQRTSPLDVKAAALDANGLLLSPQWEGIFQTSTIGDAVGTGWRDNTRGHVDSTQECLGFVYRNPLLAVGPLAGTCTRQASFDTPAHLFNVCLLEPALGRFHGHVNWTAATYIGKLAFRSQSADSSKKHSSTLLDVFSADGDIDLHLLELDDVGSRFDANFSPAGALPNAPVFDSQVRQQYRIEPILTQDSQDQYQYRHLLQLEFADDELRFVGAADTEWGKLFNVPAIREQVKKTKKKTTDNEPEPGIFHLKNHTAIVNGLLDLDCVHDCHTELHPVFAIAVRNHLEKKLEKDPLLDDTWTLFARDRGNEGSCGQNIHFLDRDEFTFYLPRPAHGAEELHPDIIVAPGDLKSNVVGLSWSATSDKGGVRFTIELKPDAKVDPDTPIGVSGIVTIKWNTTGRDEYSGNIDMTKESGSSPPKSFYKNPNQMVRVLTTIGGYFQPVVGPTMGRLWGPNAGLWPGGVQASVVSTALFSLHGEVDWAKPRQVTSTLGSQYEAHATLWLAGIDLGIGGIRSFPNLFLQLDGGKINRSADPKIPNSPPFEHFHGKDSVLSAGLGYTFHPFKAPQFSIRTFMGDLYIPATHDHIFQINVSPQFRIRKTPE